MQPMIYVLGSLKNAQVPHVGNLLRAKGWDVFDDWHGGGPEADDEWKRYEQVRGRSYTEALYDRYANHIFSFDREHLDLAVAGVLLLPAGKSAHLELGYLAGQGKRTYILYDQDESDTSRWEVMYQFATGVAVSEASLLEMVGEPHG